MCGKIKHKCNHKGTKGTKKTSECGTSCPQKSVGRITEPQRSEPQKYRDQKPETRILFGQD
jgi:hypothetical protein